MNFFRSLARRLAQRRLLRSLERCSLEDLNRASALQDFFRTTSLYPGDKISFHFLNSGKFSLEINDAVSDDVKQLKQLLEL